MNHPLETPNIYNYERDSFRFLSVSKADPDPLDEGNWLIPALATLVAVPEIPTGHFATFDEVSQTWNLSLDNQEPIDQVQAQPLENRIKVFRSKVDADVDWITFATIGNRAQEYLRAEIQAQAFKDAGYPADAVPPAVDSAVQALGGTAQEQADDILVQASLWYGVQDSMRLQRLTHKHQALGADESQLAALTASWDAFVSQITQVLGG